MSQSIQYCLTAVLILAGAAHGGCVSSPVESQAPAQPAVHIASLGLLPPLVQIIDASTGNALPADASGDRALRSELLTSLQSELATKPFGAAQVNSVGGEPSLSDSGLTQLYRSSKNNGLRMTDERRKALRALAAPAGATDLLFCRYRMNLGPGGYWDPLSGVIASPSSRAVLECHLYNVHRERSVWRHAAQVRTGKNGPSAMGDLARAVIGPL